MIEFAQKIDMRNRKKMTEYLKNHFRYYTANSWNRSTSYACNLKIYMNVNNLWIVWKSR